MACLAHQILVLFRRSDLLFPTTLSSMTTRHLACILLTFTNLAIVPNAMYGQTGRYTWTVFSALNKAQDVSFDAEGRLWVGTTGGVVGFGDGDSNVILRTSDGLMSLNTTAISVEPSSGDLYIGAGDGTVSIKRAAGGWSYSTEISALEDRPSRTIRAFAFGERGVYIATAFGIGLYDPHDSVFIESYLRFGPWPSNTAVNCVAIYAGRLWIGTDLGMSSAALDGPTLASPSSWIPVGALSGTPVTSIAQVAGVLVLGTASGAYDFDGTVATLRSDLPQQSIYVRGGNGVCVAAAGTTVFALQSQSGAVFQEIGIAPEQIAAVAPGPGGAIGVAMPTQGFGVFVGGKLTIERPNAPGSNRFTDLALAADGSIWAASGDREDDGAGVSRLSDGVWTTFTPATTPALATTKVWNVGVGAEESVWAGTFGGGAVEFRSQSDGQVVATRYDTSNSPLLGIPNARAFVLTGKSALDRYGRTWITNWDEAGTMGPIVVVKLAPGEAGSDGSGWESFVHPTFRQRPYKWLVIDDYDTKWLGADLSLGSHPGLVYLNDNGTPWDATDDATGVINTSSGGMLSDRQTALAIDRDGELWIGTPNGISVLVNPGSVVTSGSRPVFRTITALRDQFVRSIAVDALNRKWIATEKGVIVLSFDGLDVLFTFTTSNSPLVNDDVRSLLAVEATGDVYIGTINGLSRVRTEAVVGSRTAEVLRISPQPLLLPSSDGIRIDGLPENAVVKILTVSGALVRELNSPGGAVAFWDGLDSDGYPVRSGVYVVAAASPQGDVAATGKVAVVSP